MLKNNSKKNEHGPATSKCCFPWLLLGHLVRLLIECHSTQPVLEQAGNGSLKPQNAITRSTAGRSSNDQLRFYYNFSYFQGLVIYMFYQQLDKLPGDLCNRNIQRGKWRLGMA